MFVRILLLVSGRKNNKGINYWSEICQAILVIFVSIHWTANWTLISGWATEAIINSFLFVKINTSNPRFTQCCPKDLAFLLLRTTTTTALYSVFALSLTILVHRVSSTLIFSNYHCGLDPPFFLGTFFIILLCDSISEIDQISIKMSKSRFWTNIIPVFPDCFQGDELWHIPGLGTTLVLNMCKI